MTGNKNLKKRKYALSVTKRHAFEYKHGWIKEDIGKLYMKTLVNYDMDAMLGIHYWKNMKRLVYRGKRSATSPGQVYSDFKITFVDEVIVDELYEHGFLESITVTGANKKKYKFKESDFSRLNLNDIEDIKRVVYVQLGVESYQRSLNIIKPQMGIPKIEHHATYITCLKLFGVVYEGRNEMKRFMRGTNVWTTENGQRDVQRSKVMLRRIETVLKERRHMRRLEVYVGGRPKTEYIRLFVRTE
ncbi:hypothetical protein Tco_1057719 [Tanacetum coccineum]|uniref:Uncharacterized protein n=1 Tax=Tanacetum coccineum TaxID=301880 RepID=A0ABQ5H7Y9_9ASTR